MYKLLFVIFFVFILAGCSAHLVAPTQTQSPASSTPTVFPTSTPSLVSTATPAPTETSIPTDTPTPRPAINSQNIAQLTLLHVMDVIGGHGVAWSPDGKSIALANDVGISIFSADDLTLQNSFPIKGGALFVLYNADGSKLAILKSRNSGIILDAGTGQVLRELTTYTDINDFCSDGKILTSYKGPALADKMACASYKTHVMLTNIPHMYSLVAASPDETLAAIVDYQDDLHFIELPSGKVLESIKGPVEKNQIGVTSLAISPDNKILARADTESTTVLLNITTGEQIHALTTADNVTDLAFSPDSSRLVLVSATSLQIMALSNFQTQMAGGVSPGKVNSISFSPDGKWMATGSTIGPVRIWSTENWQETALKLDDNLDGSDVVFSPNGAYLASTNNQRTIQVWDVNSGKVLLKLDASPFWFSRPVFSPDSKQFAIGTEVAEKNGDIENFHAGIQIWDVASSKLIITLLGQPYSSADEPGPGNNVYALAYSPDGKTLASDGGYYDNKIHLWNTNNEQETTVIAEHFLWIWDILFSPDGNSLFSSSGDKTVKLWDLKNKKTIRTFYFPVADVDYGLPIALSPDGQLIAVTNRNNMTVRIWQTEEGKLVFNQQLTSKFPGEQYVMAIAFSPNGGLLVVGGWDGRLYIYGLPSGN